ncbi:adenylate kinase [mine drainage metagenome]|uniref:Adenylate kinase n=2 Tax=mine drainage metagenome TaxID=410659 RepID=T0ZXJ9_9ZZZZ
MLRVVFLGPPGVGKGTQASRLATERGIPHLSTGDLLRATVAAGTPLGREAEGYMRAGQLVPDDLVLRILAGRFAEPDARAGFLLDGFPRNLAQASRLETMTALDAVLSFDLPAEVLVARLSGRRVCPVCHSVYHITDHPPKVAGRCDRDGVELVQRPDDRPEAIATRLAVYAEQTAPLLDYYRARGLLRPIAADGSPDEVAARVRAALPPP